MALGKMKLRLLIFHIFLKVFGNLFSPFHHRAVVLKTNLFSNLLIGHALHFEVQNLAVALRQGFHKALEPQLIQHFMLFSDEKIALDATENEGNEEFDEEVLHMRQLLKTKLVDMDLSVRALNCLKSAEVETLSELVVFNKTDLLKFRNFGKKSLLELEDLLANLGLSFGMDISKYKLDKE